MPHDATTCIHILLSPPMSYRVLCNWPSWVFYVFCCCESHPWFSCSSTATRSTTAHLTLLVTTIHHNANNGYAFQPTLVPTHWTCLTWLKRSTPPLQTPTHKLGWGYRGARSTEHELVQVVIAWLRKAYTHIIFLFHFVLLVLECQRCWRSSQYYRAAPNTNPKHSFRGHASRDQAGPKRRFEMIVLVPGSLS